MTRSDCEQWVTLSDVASTGELLTDDERAFQRAHELDCPDCCAEARVWAALGRAREDTTVLHDAAVWVPPKRSFASKLRRARIPAVIAILMVAALAAAVPAGLRQFERTRPVAPVAPVAPALPTALGSASGNVEIDAASVTSTRAQPEEPRSSALEPTTHRFAPGASSDVNAPSAEGLLARARSLRASGHALEASQAYRHLISIWPRSPEARVGLVSLGELELSELSEPAAALRDFTAYSKARGSLDPEARYGRIRALGRLGRHAEELSEARDFVRDYPSSPQASDLRTRLSL